ncbi:MAG: tyrosine-type recombinase/integrase [Clostridia bacterium]|nr:tyrosine-type recombinase/integrase [Clostridia bacterium]
MKARYLSEREVTLLFAHMDADRRLVFEVAIQSGMRIGDVLKIRARDLKQVAPEAVEIRYTAEKTDKKGSATVYGSVAKKLLDLRKGRKGFLWPSTSKCGHITRQSAWNWIKTAANAAKIDLKGVSPHSLRKCFAVRIRHEQGMLAAQRALQHSDSAVTAIYAYSDVYSGADPDAPVLWCQVEELVDLIVARLQAKKDL